MSGTKNKQDAEKQDILDRLGDLPLEELRAIGDLSGYIANSEKFSIKSMAPVEIEAKSSPPGVGDALLPKGKSDQKGSKIDKLSRPGLKVRKNLGDSFRFKGSHSTEVDESERRDKLPVEDDTSKQYFAVADLLAQAFELAKSLPLEKRQDLLSSCRKSLVGEVEGVSSQFSKVSSAEDLGNLLTTARKSVGGTQKLTAQKMETDQSAIYRIEKGRANPTWNTIQKYAESNGLEISIQITPKP